MKYLFSLLTLFISVCAFTQEDYYGNTLNSNLYALSNTVVNPTVQPPDVAAFQKSTFVPVSNYTGKANINVPIYEVKTGAMSVPIVLSYNSGGVKVADMASSVGLNWSLSAGGMVSRIVKGMDDFHIPSKSATPEQFMTPSGWLGYEHPNIANFSNNKINRYNDAQPDLFTVNAPGISTSYVHTNPFVRNANGTVSLGSTPRVLELEHQGNIIDETLGYVNYTYLNDYTGNMQNTYRYGVKKIEITNLNGIVYNFATPDLSRHHSALQSVIAYKFDTYRLDSMYDPSTNQTITFEYEQYSNYFKDEMDPGVTSYNGGTAGLTISNNKNYTVYPVTQRLTKIVFDKGTVEFIYGLNRLDNTGDKALTEIKVKDSNGNVVKHIKLDHSYFQSAIQSNTPQSKRLKLDRVYEVDPANVSNELPGHTFTYNTALEMPPRTSYAHDFLGYNNGSYSSTITTPVPKFYFRNNRVSPFASPIGVALPGNYSLEANEAYAKTYALTKITFPTGGYNEYEYELNKFDSHEGGGLRIKSQKLNDGDGNEQILDYQYYQGSIGKMPIYAVMQGSAFLFGANPSTLSELYNKLALDTFMTPQSQVEFTNGSFVGYKTVVVLQKSNNTYTNGYTYYEYSSPLTNPNTESTKTYNSSNANSASWIKIGVPDLYVDLDFMRGKLLKETIYNIVGDYSGQGHTKRLEKTYNYTYKEFSTLPLYYMNKSNAASNCYGGDGVYSYPTCGGYEETINMPIARYMLTSVVTKDHPEEPTQTPFTTVDTYAYDQSLPLVVREEKVNCSGFAYCQELESNDYDYQIIKEIQYPIKNGVEINMPYASELILQNRLATPMRYLYKNTNNELWNNGVDEIVNKEENYFNNYEGKILLEKTKITTRNYEVTESGIVTKRDAKGNILEYKKRSGVYVANIYGYNNNYMVAQIENVRYSEIEALSSFGVNFSIANTLNTTQENALRALPNTMVSTYTYNELIGVTSVTDAKGYTMYYEYDEFNRLKQVKDKDGKVLSHNVYHYKNQ